MAKRKGEKTEKAKEGRMEKKRVAILGTADTIVYTPWLDPELEIWAVGSCVNHQEFKRCDRLFEMHFRTCGRATRTAQDQAISITIGTARFT